MTTGERIKAARKAAGITQAELSKKLGISYVGVSQWENNLRNPKFETIKRIAKALDVDVYELLGDDARELYVEGEASALFRGLGKNYSFSERERVLVRKFNKLNPAGQEIAVERVEELTEIPKYQKEKPPQCDEHQDG